MFELLFFDLLIGIGAVLCLFFSIILMVYRKKMRSTYFLSTLFFTGGYILFYYWLLSKGHIHNNPLLLHSVISASFLMGPAFYLYFKSLLEYTEKKAIPLFVHYIPAAVSMIFFIVSSIANPRFLLPDVGISLTGSLIPSGNTLVSFISILSDVTISIYLLLTLFKVIPLIREEKADWKFRILIVFIMLLSLSTVLLVIAGSIKNFELLIAALIGIIMLSIFYMLFTFRFPEFSLKVLAAESEMRYRKSIIGNLDVGKIRLRLKSLMEEEELFTSEELNLKKLSTTLNISKHQLSQILNQQYSMNFRSFLNGYRVRKAKAMLIEQPETSILDIMLSVGFNSKSSFYSAFQNEAGCNPKEFRKNSNQKDPVRNRTGSL